MQLDSRLEGDVQIVTVQEERVDAAVAVRFKDAVRDATQGGPARVVLDMAPVRFLDSSGLGAVVGAMKQLSPDQKLELAALTPPVMKVFKLTRMDSIFRIHETATDSLGASGGAAHAC